MRVDLKGLGGYESGWGDLKGGGGGRDFEGEGGWVGGGL